MIDWPAATPLVLNQSANSLVFANMVIEFVYLGLGFVHEHNEMIRKHRVLSGSNVKHIVFDHEENMGIGFSFVTVPDANYGAEALCLEFEEQLSTGNGAHAAKITVHVVIFSIGFCPVTDISGNAKNAVSCVDVHGLMQNVCLCL